MGLSHAQVGLVVLLLTLIGLEILGLVDALTDHL